MSPSSSRHAPDLAALIADLGGARDLDPARAFTLFEAMLAGEVPQPELDTILLAFRDKGMSAAETMAFVRALDGAAGRIDAATESPRPVVLASYEGTLRPAYRLPLLALLLRRYGVPVLIHGPAMDRGDAAAGRRDVTSEILRELGIEPARDLADAQRLLAQHRVAYVPLTVLAPGLAGLLAAGERLGGPSFAHALVSLVDPFHGDGYRVVAVTPPGSLSQMRELLIATRARALLHATEERLGADAQDRVRIETFADGAGTVCDDKEIRGADEGAAHRGAGDAAAIAARIAQMLAGSIPVPSPVIAELACCLQGARRTFA